MISNHLSIPEQNMKKLVRSIFEEQEETSLKEKMPDKKLPGLEIEHIECGNELN